jgi:hypothetical protein
VNSILARLSEQTAQLLNLEAAARDRASGGVLVLLTRPTHERPSVRLRVADVHAFGVA